MVETKEPPAPAAEEGQDRIGSLLTGWMTRAQVAAEISVSIDTLQRWETRRTGPPSVRIGRKVFYRAEAFRDWLISREHTPRSPRQGAGR